MTSKSGDGRMCPLLRLLLSLTTCDCKQTGALGCLIFVWRERTGSDLAVELRGPAAGNLGGAARAAAFGSQAVVLNEISVTADQRFAALRAAGIFPGTDHAGKISGVDVTKACLLTNFGSAQ